METGGLAPRRLAWKVLEAVAAGAYADNALERELAKSNLAPLYRGLATESAARAYFEILPRKTPPPATSGE
jgi:16S rRNA (cytosine967-C5)-methyltransferase